MNFELTTEQQMLRDSVRRYVEKHHGIESRTTPANGEAADHWRVFADNGWLAAALPEACGGLGGSLVDAAIIAQEFGRGLVTEPYLGCAVLAAQTLVAGGTPAQCEALLSGLIDGGRRVALAYSEIETRGLASPVHTHAVRIERGYRLSGTKTLVLGGAEADSFIVAASLPDTNAITLFIVEADSDGLTRQVLPLHDGSRAAQLSLDGVEVGVDAVVGVLGGGLFALQHGIAHGVAVLCAELVGVMEKAIEITADYLKVRQQFGVPIGSFQALQHRMADMAAELELARSMLHALLASIANDAAELRHKTVSQAKALVGSAARSVCAQAIQLHGGIGITEEYAIGHYFKRAMVAELLLGSGGRHEAVAASQLRRELLEPAADEDPCATR